VVFDSDGARSGLRRFDCNSVTRYAATGAGLRRLALFPPALALILVPVARYVRVRRCLLPRRFGMIKAQIQSPNQLPNGAHTVLVFYQLLHLHGAQQQLSAINRYQSRNSGFVGDHARSLHIAASSADSISSHVADGTFPVSGFRPRFLRMDCRALTACTTVRNIYDYDVETASYHRRSIRKRLVCARFSGSS